MIRQHVTVESVRDFDNTTHKTSYKTGCLSRLASVAEISFQTKRTGDRSCGWSRRAVSALTSTCVAASAHPVVPRSSRVVGGHPSQRFSPRDYRRMAKIPRACPPVPHHRCTWGLFFLDSRPACSDDLECESSRPDRVDCFCVVSVASFLCACKRCSLHGLCRGAARH